MLKAHDRQQRGGELGQVPNGDFGLLAEGVAPELVDRGKHHVGVIGIHEGAGAVVDGFPRDRHVVGVHDPVDEAHAHPSGNEPRLRGHDRREQVKRCLGLGVVAGDHVIGQCAQRLFIAARGEILERAHADMRTCHAGQHRTGAHAFAMHFLARGHGCQRAGGGNAERMHRLADHVFTQHRPKPGAPVAPAREGRRAGALELDVAPRSVGADHLAKQHGAPVAKLRHPPSELVARIGLRQRGGALWHMVPRQHRHALGAFEPVRIEPKLGGKVRVHLDQCRGPNRGGGERPEETLGQAGIGIVEGDLHGGVLSPL